MGHGLKQCQAFSNKKEERTRKNLKVIMFKESVIFFFLCNILLVIVLLFTEELYMPKNGCRDILFFFIR
jgi:hypothetical protein